jgi:hypothetical protein
MEWITVATEALNTTALAVPPDGVVTAAAASPWWTNGLAGVAGGAALGVGRALLTALRWDHGLPTPKLGQMWTMHAVVVLLFMILGGLVAHYMAGTPGAFVTGITAMGFILLVGADSVGAKRGVGDNA